MIDSLAQLLLTGKFSDVPAPAAVLYFTLRADIAAGYTATARLEKKNLRLVSGLDLQALARIIGVPEATASRLIDDLAKRKLISRETLKPHNTLYILGHITDQGTQWLADASNEMRASKTSDLSPSEVLKRKLEEDRNRVRVKENLLPRDLQQKITNELFKTPEEKKKPGQLKQLLEHFKERYRVKYAAEPDLVMEGRANPVALTNVYLKRCIKMSGSFNKAVASVDFLFDHWDKLQAAYGWPNQIMITNLGSSKTWRLLLLAMEDGIPSPRKKNAGSRYDSKAMEEASDKGWE